MSSAKTPVKILYNVKQRTGWEVIPRLNYYSGFKNQGPFFEADTDYIGGESLVIITVTINKKYFIYHT